MKRTFIELPLFIKRWKSLGLNDDDLRKLQYELLLNPKIGDVIQETGGIRKMRFAFNHQGKSGGARIIYIDFEVHESIYLITAYTKNEKENLSKEERNELRKLVEVIERQLNE